MGVPKGVVKSNAPATVKYPVDLGRVVNPVPISKSTACSLEQIVTGGYNVAPFAPLPKQVSLPNGVPDGRIFSQEESTTVVEAQSELYTNLSYTYAATNDYGKAEKLIDVAQAMNPKAIAP